MDPAVPTGLRVKDLIGRMSIEEKASQMQDAAVAIPRLGVPAYGWWNEALHGVARRGIATVFPQAIALGATWDRDLLLQVGDTISTEARAKFNESPAGDKARYFGLTFWSPNINIFRDPRWGRGQETYGEDPYLTGRLGTAFVLGVQGGDSKYLKAVATPKHFAVHSGPESTRHKVNVEVSKHDLEDTYLPAFRMAITEGHADSVMCAYNSVDGQPACANGTLLQKHLVSDWGFRGYVVSDCDAVGDIFKGHHFVKDTAEASAVAVKAGTDLDCGGTYKALPEAVKRGLIQESEIDAALTRLFTARFKLGMFDPPATVPWSSLAPSENDSAAHRQLALQAARESIVLLKNDGVLPLQGTPHTIAVIGPTAESIDVMRGNYSGEASKPVFAREGFANRFKNSTVVYAQGAVLAEGFTPKPAAGAPTVAPVSNASLIEEAVRTAKSADVVFAFVGLSPQLEGEEMNVHITGFDGGDRTDINLPASQQQLLEALKQTGKPLVVVLNSGSALGVNWAQENANAVLEQWYPGEEGGDAIAQTAAGDVSPSGRLPVTFYHSVDDLPAFADYAMKNRTYRYFAGKVLYPFGYGLSYVKFRYGTPVLSAKSIHAGDTLEVTVPVTNEGAREADEVVECYLTAPRTPVSPKLFLAGFQRVHLAAGETRRVKIPVAPRQMSEVDADGKRAVMPGEYVLSVGGGQPDTGAPGVTAKFAVSGMKALPE
ncbi:MAG: glycoside hydrolase family 3 C-terminal domain-containing protein [Acidobacteriota bacterium]|nr:glycoside hydrolase family 3 C-terminal domain-containing protein [Acidobacteriota bacterium]